jgi:plasmid stability protein
MVACNECNAYTKPKLAKRGVIMAIITIRNLDESVKISLRIRAATHGLSMEEEARQILRAALQSSEQQGGNLAQRIRARMEPLGGVDLPTMPRDPVRDPPNFQ